MRTNYVLIDFESVQTKSLELLTHDHFKVIVFVGANQGKLPFELAVSLHQLGPRAEYIEISGHGLNALDFHIAYYIGRLAVEEPSAYFHIISKDTDFDPLIQHLRSKKILAGRVTTIADIPVVKASNSKSPHERIAVIARLQQLKASKPRTVKTLSSTATRA
ncbi:MAG TPA: PIN domain-containing protein [Pyrinomonadaceae bacterium]|nr:PIN domain-containing protein [Pyrinomonadaceae bacterium]HKU75933.1 PIN domain-containing protein [Pyrinomonadaceae bacterium]